MKKSLEDRKESNVIAEILYNILEGEEKKASGDLVELPIGDDRGWTLFEGMEKIYYRDDGAVSECMVRITSSTPAKDRKN